MGGRSPRVLAVVYAVEQARADHAELQFQRLNGARIRDVLIRERIVVVRAPIRKSRALVDDLGNAAILLSTRGQVRDQWKRLAHEYAHIKLHFMERGEIVCNEVSCNKGDPREDEANLFAALLVGGPTATPDDEGPAGIVARMTAADRKNREPLQIPLALPVSMPEYRPPSIRMGHGSHNPDAIRRTKKGQRPRLLGSAIGLGVSHDSLRFDWSKEGKPLRFFHYELGWLDVYDTLLTGRHGRPRWEVIECGDRRATRRRFIISSSDRRDYWFAEGEKRTRSVDALNAQISRAERGGHVAAVSARRRTSVTTDDATE
jgi:hypothetical protein